MVVQVYGHYLEALLRYVEPNLLVALSHAELQSYIHKLLAYFSVLSKATTSIKAYYLVPWASPSWTIKRRHPLHKLSRRTQPFHISSNKIWCEEKSFSYGMSQCFWTPIQPIKSTCQNSAGKHNTNVICSHWTSNDPIAELVSSKYS